MKMRSILALLVAVIALGGCGNSGGSDDAGSSGAGASTSTTAADPGATEPGPGDGACPGFATGENGVIRTFCEGTAKAAVTVDGASIEFSGGECTTAGDILSINIGVVTGTGYQGEMPDYFGANVPSAAGEFGEGTVITYASGGAPVSLTDVTGTHDGDKGSFSGTLISGGNPVTGSFSC